MANPTHTAKPITIRTSITRGSLRLGRSLDQSFHGAWGESSEVKGASLDG